MSCNHDLNREHIRHFAFSNLDLKIEYEPVQLYEICTPPMRQRQKTYVIDKMKEEDMEILRGKINSFYDSILQRVIVFTYDIIPVSRQQIARDTFQELGKRAASEKKLMIQLLQQTHISSSPLDSISLNSVYKQLVEKVALWDAEFADFVRLNLQQDTRDIGRAALKRIFVPDANGNIQPDPKSSLPPLIPDGLAETRSQAITVLDKQKIPVLGSSPSSLLAHADVSEMKTSERLMPSREMSTMLEDTLLKKSNLNLPEIGNTPTMPAIDIDYKMTPFLLTTDDAARFPSPSHDHELMSLPDPENYGFDELFEENTEGIMYPRQIFNTQTKSRLENHTISRNSSSKATEKSLLTHSNKSFTSITASAGKYEEEEFRNLEEEDLEGVNTFTGVTGEAADGDPFGPAPQSGERTSLMQTISNLWTGNIANFAPLAYPSYI